MNIFKTLANGSGRINENNVSAFLGYLLNPKEDHGLGDAFLKRFLEPLLKENKDLIDLKGRNFSIRSNFEIEVLLEQAFKIIKDEDSDDNEDTTVSNQIVDIVILCYKKKSQDGRFLAEEIIQQKKEGVGDPEHIFLIENKVKGSSKTDWQLTNQYTQTIQRLVSLGIPNPEKLVSVIYVTPDDKDCINEFSKFNKTENKYHLFWESRKGTTISKILKDIIENETQPIDVNCLHTLKAFLEFVESDFQSKIKEEAEERTRLDPRFELDGQKFSRPRLAVKIISDYVSDKDITFAKLSKMFGKNMKKKMPPIIKVEEADKHNYRPDGTLISKNFAYCPDIIKLKDAEIRIQAGWYDEKELQDLLDKTVKLKLDDLRIK